MSHINIMDNKEECGVFVKLTTPEEIAQWVVDVRYKKDLVSDFELYHDVLDSINNLKKDICILKSVPNDIRGFGGC